MKKLILKLLSVGVLLGVLGVINIETYTASRSFGPIIIQAQHAADFSNNEVLVGSSHDIFIGKVIKKNGDKERGIGPETQFEVEIIESIKGELNGNVVVNQQGGYKNGVLYVVGDGDILAKANGEDYLLQEGETYLLATRYNEKENWHTLNFHPNASKLISKDKEKKKDELKTLAQNDDKVRKLKAAYPNEILLEADIKNNNTLNSYKSVHEKKAKQQEDKKASNQVENQNPTVEPSATEASSTVDVMATTTGSNSESPATTTE